MERIELKISAKPLVTFFLIFFLFASAFLGFFAQNQPLALLLTITFFGSLIVAGATYGILYINQKEVILTNAEITKVGISSTTIPYSDIEKIRVGSNGFSIYHKGNNPINITTTYSNFAAARELLNEKIKKHSEIEITGFSRFVKKYIPEK